MATTAQTLPGSSPPLAWFGKFLKVELTPYPGRAALVGRMTLAATLVMIICMTFRISYGFQGAVYALIVSRESQRATLQSAATMLVVTCLGAAYISAAATFVISVPTLHFVSTIISFFTVFFVLSTMTNYSASVTFGFTIALAVPLWDRHVSAETNLEDTLRVLLAAMIGVVVTAVIELAFANMQPGDDIVLPVAERLAAVESLLACYADNRPLDGATEQKIIRFGMLGTSILRRSLRRSKYSPQYRAQMGGVVAFVGRLVNITANLTQLRFEPSSTDRKQLRDLAAAVAIIRTDLMNRQIPRPIQFNPNDEASRDVPLLHEIENIVALIPQAFAASGSMDEYAPSDDMPRSKLFAPDLLTNPEHLEFALKGCLAASLCYIIYNSIDWPGISTAVTTCTVTALSTIGSSRQKQLLRFAGALVGGFLIGMGSQVFILPYLDSIAGFTVLFVLVTVVAAWIMTSSPRLSYFGLQLALAFYLINLQEFAIQTSLAVARDRVVGILLGLFMMWLVFDQIWGASASLEMKRKFISIVRLLAQYTREPLSSDRRVATQRSFSLRETINNSFEQVRELGDGVLFEFGPSRQYDLALRNRINRLQPQLRTLFLTRIALWEYRAQRPGFEFPVALRMAQQEFDGRLALALDGMANRLEGKAPQASGTFESPLEPLEQVVRSCCSEGPQQLPAGELQAFLALSRNIDHLTTSLEKEI